MRHDAEGRLRDSLRLAERKTYQNSSHRLSTTGTRFRRRGICLEDSVINLRYAVIGEDHVGASRV